MSTRDSASPPTTTTKLRLLLERCRAFIPAFVERIPAALPDSDAELTQLFATLPICHKEDMIDRYMEFVDARVWGRDGETIKKVLHEYKHNIHEVDRRIELGGGKCIFLERTSGSSGMPFNILKNGSERLRSASRLWNLRKRITPELRPAELLSIGHRSETCRYTAKYLNSLSGKSLVQFIESGGYKWIHASPGKLRGIAENLRVEGVQMPSTLQACEANGTFLATEVRRQITQQLSLPIINHYGCREVWAVAYDCPAGYLHVNEDAVKLEILKDENNDGVDWEFGPVVITGLYGEVMPFVRYKLGDLAKSVSGECQCGAGTRRIVLAEGRVNQRILGHRHIFGNTLFRAVLNKMSRDYNIADYASVYVTQIEKDFFKVYVARNREPMDKFQRSFKLSLEQATSELGTAQFAFIFTEAPPKQDGKEILFWSEVPHTEDAELAR